MEIGQYFFGAFNFIFVQQDVNSRGESEKTLGEIFNTVCIFKNIFVPEVGFATVTDPTKHAGLHPNLNPSKQALQTMTKTTVLKPT